MATDQVASLLPFHHDATSSMSCTKFLDEAWSRTSSANSTAVRFRRPLVRANFSFSVARSSIEILKYIGEHGDPCRTLLVIVAVVAVGYRFVCSSIGPNVARDIFISCPCRCCESLAVLTGLLCRTLFLDVPLSHGGGRDLHFLRTQEGLVYANIGLKTKLCVCCRGPF